MPVKIPDGLPAIEVLARENIFLMTERRAQSQDIRPLQIAILNLMPTKLATEAQLLRLLGNTPLQVEVTLLHTESYASRHTEQAHLKSFYRTFAEIRERAFDGLIVTGAPVEQMAFEDVAYWNELCEIMDWAETHAFSTFFICWAAQAALYHFYGVRKRPLSQKLFGVYEHRVLLPSHELVRGFDPLFYAPHSRHTEVSLAEVTACADIEALCASEAAGLYLAASRDGSRIFVTGHSEYDAGTLEAEYRRDVEAGLPIAPPCGYYPQDDPARPPAMRWRAHGSLLFANWLNYFVYQRTPYDIRSVYAHKQYVRQYGREGGPLC